jgi:outer membrane protein assembly factor BamB
MKKAAIAVAAFAVMAAGLVFWNARRSECWRPVEPSEIDDPAQLDDLHVDLPKIEPDSWVQLFHTSKAESGFNLVFYGRRLPMIIDMNGRIVHSWPKVRATGRVRLDHDGNLLVIGTDNLVKEYDWEGRLTWYYQLPDEHDLPHHDLIRLRNGNSLILGHDGHTHTDYLHEVDREGRVIWDWQMHSHRLTFPNWDEESTDPSHSNSIRELGSNRWYDAGDLRFRPGNILVSARNLNTIFIIDKQSGKVVWQFSEGLDHQHEAVMVGDGLTGEGLIMVFNNGLDDLHAYRQSRVQAIDPVAKEVVWEYASTYLFSSVGGTVQPLPGGNVFVTSSHGGRAFEITPDGEIVWQWVPPYRPMRVERIPYDHCPQLADLGRPRETEIRSDDHLPYIDMELYTFALPEELVIREVAGRERKLVPSNNDCRALAIPPDATLLANFGVDESASEDGWNTIRFMMTIDDGETKTLVDDTVSSDAAKLWRRRRVNLDRYDSKRVRLCISTEIDGGGHDSRALAVWANPIIESTTQRPPRTRIARRVTKRERKLQKQQLEALGYVD